MTHAVTIGAVAAAIGAIIALAFLPARPRADADTTADLGPLVVSTAQTMKTAPKGVFDAALSLMSEAGFASLSFSGVATRAGVSTATIERLWTSKLDMVTSVVEQMQAEVPIPDTGSLRDDCEQFVDGVIRVMAAPDARPVIANLVGEAGRDPELAAKLRARLIAPRRAEVVRMLATGRARAELPPDADLGFLADLLVSPLYYRVLVSGEPLDPGLAHEITDAVLGPAPAGAV
jgi:AcrR family transcriptional regulator